MGTHRRRTLDQRRTIQWLPAGDSYYVWASILTSSREAESLCVVQRVLAQLDALCHTDDRRSLGILTGQRCECPRTRARYLLVDGLRAAPSAASDDDDTRVIEQLAELSARAGYEGRTAVGWFRSGAPVPPDPILHEAALHRMLFQEPWHIMLLCNGEIPHRVGAFVRVEPLELRPYAIPFLEWLPTPRQPSRCRSAVSWANYHTSVDVVRPGAVDENAPPPSQTVVATEALRWIRGGVNAIFARAPRSTASPASAVPSGGPAPAPAPASTPTRAPMSTARATATPARAAAEALSTYDTPSSSRSAPAAPSGASQSTISTSSVSTSMTVAAPIISEPAVSEPLISEPVISEPAISEPTIAAPESTISAPAASALAASAPAVSPSTTSASTGSESTVVESTDAESTVAGSAAAESSVAESSVAESSVAESTTSTSRRAEAIAGTSAAAMLILPVIVPPPEEMEEPGEPPRPALPHARPRSLAAAVAALIVLIGITGLIGAPFHFGHAPGDRRSSASAIESIDSANVAHAEIIADESSGDVPPATAADAAAALRRFQRRVDSLAIALSTFDKLADRALSRPSSLRPPGCIRLRAAYVDVELADLAAGASLRDLGRRAEDSRIARLRALESRVKDVRRRLQSSPCLP